jgi:hypothetical protein
MLQVHEIGTDVAYIKENDKMTFGDALVVNISYVFRHGKFVSTAITAVGKKQCVVIFG